jgi:hypothetical protein
MKLKDLKRQRALPDRKWQAKLKRAAIVKYKRLHSSGLKLGNLDWTAPQQVTKPVRSPAGGKTLVKIKQLQLIWFGLSGIGSKPLWPILWHFPLDYSDPVYRGKPIFWGLYFLLFEIRFFPKTYPGE